MDQSTTFSPHVHVKLIDGRTVKFARSMIEHWVNLCEQYKANAVAGALAEIDAIPTADLKPVARAAARTEARELEVPIGAMAHRCIHSPAWLKAHLLAALEEAGGDTANVLPLIPWQQQQEIAHVIAMLPVVKNDATGSEANPIVAGVEFASTGASTSSSTNDTAPASPSAD